MSESPYIYHVTQEDFTQRVIETSHRVPVMVDFWADWCGPCHMLMPVLAKLADEYKGQFLLAKVNSDEQQGLASHFRIRSLPTVRIFKNGDSVDEFMGVQPESVIREIIERHIERESDKLRHEAFGAAEAGDTELALQLLQQAARLDPSNTQIKIDLARILMKNGEPERAEIVLDDLSGPDREKPAVKSLKAQLAFGRVASLEPDRRKLELQINKNPNDLKSRYRLSAHNIIMGEFDAAMDQLFEIMRRDRNFEDDAGRKGLLAVFEILGNQDKRVQLYRSKMFNVLH